MPSYSSMCFGAAVSTAMPQSCDDARPRASFDAALPPPTSGDRTRPRYNASTPMIATSAISPGVFAPASGPAGADSRASCASSMARMRITWRSRCALRRLAIISTFSVEPATLLQAHVAEASVLVVATPQTIDVRRMVETARALSPAIEIVVRSHNDDEAKLLEREGVAKVFVGERELARSMTDHVLASVNGERAARSAAR